MTNRAVVVVFRFIVGRRKRGSHKSEFLAQQPLDILRNNVLMLIVRKLDRELAGSFRFTERESSFVAWRHLCMTTATDYGTRTFKELSSMATHTGIVVRVVGDVRKGARLLPVTRRYLVAGVARLLMFLSRVREL